jgi:hypothetical protein
MDKFFHSFLSFSCGKQLKKKRTTKTKQTKKQTDTSQVRDNFAPPISKVGRIA